jgi:hypothetical protein
MGKSVETGAGGLKRRGGAAALVEAAGIITVWGVRPASIRLRRGGTEKRPVIPKNITRIIEGLDQFLTF